MAKEELARECNYELEAEYQKRFKKLLENEPGIHVPAVIDEFCSKCVITSELVPGKSFSCRHHIEVHINSCGGEIKSYGSVIYCTF